MAEETNEQLNDEKKLVKSGALKKTLQGMRDRVYTRDETYSRDEIYSKDETYSKEETDLAIKEKGLTPWQKQHLESLEETEVKSKMVATCALSPASKESTGEPVNITVTVTCKYNGVLEDAEVVGKDGLVFTKKSTGTYQATATYAVPTNDNGTNSKTYGATVNYLHEASDSIITKDATASFNLYSQCVILQTAGTGLPTAAQISGGTNKRKAITGTYDINVTPGQYVWLCVPKGLTQIKDIKSSGFGVPYEAAQNVSVQIGSQTVTYICYRISGAPQSSPMSVVIS